MRPPSVPVTQKVCAVQVDRVMVSRAEIHQPDAGPGAQPDHQRRRPRAAAPVERQGS